MRRQNSSFNTAFVSHEGTQLNNNDYFGYVTLDKFACYVIADGMESWDEVNSAQAAVESVISAFTAHASMGKNALGRYIRTAHANMKGGRTKLSMKASLTVVVTDYVSLRYGYVGNTRFNLFRSGFLHMESVDHSQSTKLVTQHELAVDKVARHEERGNLYRYLGQEGKIHPQISQKIALKDGDIVALFTRGVWENCDSYDMLAAFTDAGNYPMIACDLVERLIIDPNPGEIDNYTLAVVFVDKIFTDPNKGKRLKLILKIAIPVAVVLIALLVVLLVLQAQKNEKQKNMELYYLSGIEYIQDNNFVKAQEEMDKAYDLAVDIKDVAYREDIAHYQKLLELILSGDDLLAENKFTEAQEKFLMAKNRSAYTENLALSYIEGRLDLISQYMEVHDKIDQGDMYAEQSKYDQAEEEYQDARNLANRLNYQEGRDAASDALTALEDKRKAAEEQEAEDERKENLNREAKELQDKAETSGSLDEAKSYYEQAKSKYSEAGNDKMVTSMDEKILTIDLKIKDKDGQYDLADEYVKTGDALRQEGNYAEAKKQYLLARDIYTKFNDNDKLELLQSKIKITDAYLTDSKNE